MPLFKKIIDKNFILEVWELTEPESFFIPYKENFSANPENLDKIHVEQRRKEWLCSRFVGWRIAIEMEGHCAGIWSDLYNKPHIKNSTLQISISHAKPYVAVLVHKTSSCGVDIEEKREKLQRLAHKFLTPNELNQANSKIDALALAWGAKEAIYKLYGRKKLIFKEHISLSNLNVIQKNGILKSKLNVDNNSSIIELKYEFFNNHILVYTV